MSDFSQSIGPVTPRDMHLDFGEAGFALENGETLPELDIRYETYGELDETKANVVWICSPLTADAHVAGFYTKDDKKPGWWDALIGSGKPIDTDRFFVVCSNILGGCKGTTGPASTNPKTGKPYGSSFPTITIADMVHAQKALADALGIRGFYCVVGGSMGGFQAMKWTIFYPDFIEKCVLIATSPRFSSQALGFETVARFMILEDPNFCGGNYYEAGKLPSIGLSAARQLAHITYLSAVGMENRFKRDQIREHDPKHFKLGSPLESYLDHQGKKFVERFDANSYLHVTYATDLFDLETEYGSLEAAFQNVKAEFLNVNLSTDWLFPPHESRRITQALLNAGKKITSLELDSQFGHDGFLIEVGDLGKAVGRFLENEAKAEKETLFEKPIFFDYQEMLASLIPENSKVLDIGCGDGRLLKYLNEVKKTEGGGIEKDFTSILSCLKNGVPVIEQDLDERGFCGVNDDLFDIAVLNRTLQEIRSPVKLLHEILRVAKKVVIAFPNFGHWKIPLALFYHRHMPKSTELPYEWHNTPNIHLFTLRDFTKLCREEGFKIENMITLNSGKLSKLLTFLGFETWGTERVIALISKKD